MRTTPELIPSPYFHTTPMGRRLSLVRFNVQWPPLHGGSSAASGFHFLCWPFTASTTQRIDITKRVSLASSVDNRACLCRHLGSRSISSKSFKRSD
ncbi:hypothetical protein TNCV_1587251 [Trichonephila clavipes]|nr:hypothetical protein TNCV_1587251 [Trichonephila clavipes]